METFAAYRYEILVYLMSLPNGHWLNLLATNGPVLGKGSAKENNPYSKQVLCRTSTPSRQSSMQYSVTAA